MLVLRQLVAQLVRLPAGGLLAWSLHGLPLHAWILYGYSGFLPHSKNIIGLSKFPLGVKGCCLSSVLPCDGDLFRLYPPLTCRPLQRGTSSPATQYGRSGYRKWMDGF
ncbi:hypothetical protein ILYODFUR_003625 [Ilyodon furcidens]|uniref:Secreted protein n=1 Tax=Ilyodon furcidens TaxID=33524 RepID=A0ABV0URK2_9TELE